MIDERKKWQEYVAPIIADPTPGTRDDGIAWADAVIKRCEDVEGIAKVLDTTTGVNTDWMKAMNKQRASAVRDYLLKGGG